jgi:outer membrane protein TolC
VLLVGAAAFPVSAQEARPFPAGNVRVILLPPREASTPIALDQPSPPSAEELLSVDALVEQVLARNPSLAQMAAAFQAAQARYPQVTSLDDPMFAATIGPDTFAPDEPGTRFAYRLELSQKYPWPGKLRLRGEGARAEARAASNDVDDMRLRLIESTKDSFYEYFLATRTLEVNAENLEQLRRFRQNAEAQVGAGGARGNVQDVYQANVEIGREQKRRLTLERMQQVAVARLNTFLSLPANAPLAPPPKSLAVTEHLPDADALRAAALAGRPDLLALGNRLQADEAALALACKDYCPDFEPYVMYDRFMGNTPDTRDLATMIGVRMNLPVRLEKRRAAVAEAQARLAQRRAELARQVNDVGFEVQQAYAKVRESGQAVRLYEKTILPAAEQNIKAAQTAYITGKIPFLSLIEAQRSLVMLREQYYEAVADYFRQLATLERAVGGPLDYPPAKAGR